MTGDGDLSIALSREVRRYVALEQKGDFVKKLRSGGLEVVEASWPHPIEERFDVVLASHSLPSHSDGRETWEPFVTSAWSQVDKKGHLIIVTFEDEDSEWSYLLNVLVWGRPFKRDGCLHLISIFRLWLV